MESSSEREGNVMESGTGTVGTQETYSVFWVMRQSEPGDLDDREGAEDDARTALCSRPAVRLRGVYSLAGVRADADTIFWLISSELDALQETWVALRRTAIGRRLQPVNTYLGMAAPSQYVADHVPAFLRDVPPRRYLSVYPFVKTHEWYLLPYEERQRLMREHGELGREYPGILTNTISSFGLADQEFVVAIEGDDPGEIMRMMRHLRAAEVRAFTTYDTPIYLGRRLELDEFLAQSGT
jgi:hydrogen peroxide-dependent heme synthase